MKKDLTLVLIDELPLCEHPDAAAELVRQILVESKREWSRAPERGEHAVRVVALVLSNTQLGLRVEVHGPSDLAIDTSARAARTMWRAIASHALSVAAGRAKGGG